MKVFYKTLLGLWLLSLPLVAQTYELRVLNQSVSSSNFEFDIYILRLGSTPIYLANCDFVLTFNLTNFNGPGAVKVTGGLSGWYTLSPSIVASNKYFVSVLQPPFSDQGEFDARVTNVSPTYPGSLVGRFRITNVSNPAGSAGLQWANSGLQSTKVTTFDPDTWIATNITNPDFHLNPEDVPLPIQLSALSASVVRESDVQVTWKTVSETNNYGFEVYRKRNENGEWKKLGFIEGHGTTLASQSYTYVDRSLGFGKYSYQIKQLDLDGKSKALPEVDVTVGVTPDKLILAQNYPNPFNPSTTIEFAVPQNGFATMRVYNTLGQEVAALFSGEVTSGIYSVEWSPKNLASGVYVYRLEVESGPQHFVATRRLVLLK